MLGFNTKNTDKKFYETLLKFLEKNEYKEDATKKDILLIDVYESMGKYDYMFTIATKDNLSLKKYINSLKHTFSSWLDGEVEIVDIVCIFKKNEILNNKLNTNFDELTHKEFYVL